jgi:hypothetical protein
LIEGLGRIQMPDALEAYGTIDGFRHGDEMLGLLHSASPLP